MKYCFIGLIVVLFGCYGKKSTNPQKLHTLPAYTNDTVLQAIVEIPAGINKKINYNKQQNTFQVDSVASIKFLPSMGNYGFIPSTGNNKKPLSVLVIAESLPTGTIQEVIPIGVVELTANQKNIHKIVAIPADEKKRIIDIKNFDDLSTKYPEIRKIIGNWFSHYESEVQVVVWRGEEAAYRQVNKSLK